MLRMTSEDCPTYVILRAAKESIDRSPEGAIDAGSPMPLKRELTLC